MDLTQLHAVLSDETVATALEIPVGIFDGELKLNLRDMFDLLRTIK